MHTTKINNRGQITIPKELREKYNLEPGSEVIFEETSGGIVIEKGAVVPEWFAKMGASLKKSFDDLQKGRYEDFSSIEDLIDDLNA
ncbi:MAG: hypothetical protein MAGBODY4_01248 [Candidatus Marinimicrobia bacterium]|nr:hypothetical protein [Candidatus Neomarinimicrobiota bacterium]